MLVFIVVCMFTFTLIFSQCWKRRNARQKRMRDFSLKSIQRQGQEEPNMKNSTNGFSLVILNMKSSGKQRLALRTYTSLGGINTQQFDQILR